MMIEACQKPSASVAGLALKAGVNANQLRKWIMLEPRRAVRELCGVAWHRRGGIRTRGRKVADQDAVPANPGLQGSGTVAPMTRARDVMRASQRPLLPSSFAGTIAERGKPCELECSTQDPALLMAMIDALRSQ